MLDPDTHHLIQDRYQIGQVYRVLDARRDALGSAHPYLEIPYVQRYLILADPIGAEQTGVDVIVRLEPTGHIIPVQPCFLWQDKLWNGSIEANLEHMLAARQLYVLAGSNWKSRPPEQALVYFIINYICDLSDWKS